MVYTESVTDQNHREALQRLQKLSELMDSRFKGPLGIRIGLDGILGLVPFAGDFITTLISLGLVVSAARLGASPLTLLRMGLNILVENVVGLLPFVGDVFDILWKANLRNVKLLEEQLRNPVRTSLVSRLVVLVLIFLILGSLFLFLWLSWMIIQFFVGLLSGTP